MCYCIFHVSIFTLDILLKIICSTVSDSALLYFHVSIFTLDILLKIICSTVSNGALLYFHVSIFTLDILLKIICSTVSNGALLYFHVSIFTLDILLKNHLFKLCHLHTLLFNNDLGKFGSFNMMQKNLKEMCLLCMVLWTDVTASTPPPPPNPFPTPPPPPFFRS